MRLFAGLFRELDQSTATLDKRAALVRYFGTAQPRDAAWALHLLSGGKITSAKRKIATTRELRDWIAEVAGLPDWLVEDSYEQVGDLAETLALLLDDPAEPAPELALADWIEGRLLPVANQDVSLRRGIVTDAWRTLRFDQRLLFNKLLTGALRVGVSQRVVQQALAEMSGVDIARIAQRMLGEWTPSAGFMGQLLSRDELASDRQQPYPFYLATPLEAILRDDSTGAGSTTPSDSPTSDHDDAGGDGPASTLSGDPAAVERALGPIQDWLIEWKWDGIRLQLIRRQGDVALWSRGEERLDGRFPEIEAAAAALPVDCVLDGELLAWRGNDPQPLPFTFLQTRIQRRKPGARILSQTPARMLVYDLLELEGVDYRTRPLSDRRTALERLLGPASNPIIAASPLITAHDWSQATRLRAGARAQGVEGLMLKRASAPYQQGRKRGDWWKWKIDPLTVDAVLLYAQAGHGRRSTLYTDYTFGLWDGDTLVPVAKAYSGLDDAEIGRLDRWIRSNTLERFGPVRSVTAHHVFELGFEAVNRSSRHKSGIAVRFPRILRWRHDKRAEEADRLDTLRQLAR